MAARSISHFTLFYDQCGPGGRARASAFARFFQEAAFRHSAENGFPPSWYVEHGVAWFGREAALRIRRLPEYGDAVETETWVESFGRTRARRRYEIRRSGEVLAEAYMDWVFMDVRTMRPTAIPTRARDLFPPQPPVPDEIPLLPLGALPGEPVRGSRTVQVYDLDPNGHVNNAAYFDYADQAMADALAATGGPAFATLAPRLYRLEYLRPASGGQRLDALTWIRRDGEAWRQETHLLDGEGASPILRAAAEWAPA